MLRRYWIVTVAIGLIAIALSLQAQEQADRSAERGERHQAAPKEPLPPIRVELVEPDAAAEARQSSERERQEREEEDLVAQQQMAEATVAMNEATQSMKNAAWLSFGAVALGTALLIWTLYETRQANAAARKAVDVTKKSSKAQIRAYVGIEGGAIFQNGHGDWVAQVFFVNSGQSPAYKWRCCIAAEVTENTKGHGFFMRGKQNVGGRSSVIDLHPQIKTGPKTILDGVSSADLRGFDQVNKTVFVYGAGTYYDAFNQVRRISFLMKADMQSLLLGEGRHIILHVLERGNRSN